MNKLLARLAIAGAALSIATSAQAADVAAPSGPAYSGVIEMFGGYSMYKGDFPEIDLDDRTNNPIMGGFSAVNLPLSSGMSVQLDMSGDALFATDEDGEVDGDVTAGSLHGTVHLSGRNDSMLFGGFGGVGSTMFQDADSSTFMFGGAELQAYLGSATLYLQGGYLDSNQTEEDADDTLQEAFFARAVARLYASETSRLSAEVAYAAGEADGDESGYDPHDATVLAWGARFDQQLSDSPASVFLAYNGANYKGGCTLDDTDGYDHRVSVGLSFAFGGNSIMTNDRQGVALDTGDLGSWVGASNMNQGGDCGGDL